MGGMGGGMEGMGGMDMASMMGGMGGMGGAGGMDSARFKHIFRKLFLHILLVTLKLEVTHFV